MDYPEEWNQLPRHERRKKIKLLRREKEKQTGVIKKVLYVSLAIAATVALIVLYKLATKKSPQRVEYEQKIETISLEGKVQEFPIEGREHISRRTVVAYNTNPPTSGNHLAEAESWGVNDQEIEDKAAVHSLEHGGIWITYKDVDEETVKALNELGRENPQSVVVSPRAGNDTPIAVVSWGRMVKLEKLDKALIQKYIETYINQGPEKLAN